MKNLLSYKKTWTSVEQDSSITLQLPRPVTWSIIFICLLPLLLNLFGIDFASSEYQLNFDETKNLTGHLLDDALHQTLAGSFTHTILGWSAFCAAIFTAVLAFAHFSIKRDVTTPVIGIALLCAGIMDAFHTLAADRLIEAVADNVNLIPLTWAICRMLNALLTMIGVSIFLVGTFKKWPNNITVVTITSFIFGFIAYSIIQICATSDRLPNTIFDDSIITRPWDIAPLILFIIAGLLIYPKFYQKNKSVFAHSLIIGTIPNSMTQLHMAFGSTALFDNHFNIGHFLKVIAYLVPLTGLIIDYIETHQQLKKTNDRFMQEIRQRQTVEQDLIKSQQLLQDKNYELNKTLFKLKETQVQLVQREKMSSLGKLVGGMAHEINNPITFIYGNLIHTEEYMKDLIDLIHLYQEEYPNPSEIIQIRSYEMDLEYLEQDLPRLMNSMKNGAHRIRELIISLRNFSRLDEAELKEVNLHEGIESTLLILKNRIEDKITLNKHYHELPLVECYPAQLNQIWMNIFINAIDALESDDNLQPKEITIRTQVKSLKSVMVTIHNNGPEIPPEIKDQIFDPFFTTKPVGSGTGLGLATAYQVIEQHHGEITCQSSPNQGTAFIITLPVHFSQSFSQSN